MVATRLREAWRRASTLAGSVSTGRPSPPSIDAAIATPGPNDVGRLRRERRRLLRNREAAIRDLGGLALEMTRRATIKPALLESRGRQILELEHRVHEVDGAIETALAATPTPSIATLEVCECGAVVEAGARFCPSCARPIGIDPTDEDKPGTTCESCQSLLPVDARFCPACGEPVGDGELARDGWS